MATRILVVDDSPTIRTVVSTILERCGYDPKVASDGQDAYDALASGEVKADLILLDFVMPHMNGYQFCRALRDNADLAMTPVVLMSAKADRIRDQFVQQTGAIDAITKPFDRQALVAVIENALRKVNTNRSSARLPEFDSAELPEVGTVVGPAEYETRRTHIAQVIAQRLATIAARTVKDRPELVASGDLAGALADRLSNETVLEMMEMLTDLDRIDRSRALLSGDLGVVPIGAILQLLQAENQTGVLVCTSGTGALRSGDRASAEVRATFRNGAIDLVQSTGAGDEFRLGRFFIEEGVLTPGEIEVITDRQKPPTAMSGETPALAAVDSLDSSVQLPSRTEEIEALGPDTLPWARRPSNLPTLEDPHVVVTVPGEAVAQALALATQSGARDTSWGTAWGSKDTSAGTAWEAGRSKARPLGMALLAAGKIVDSQLRTALTRQSSELLYEVLRWQSGRFELRREPPSELALNAKLGLPVASVVMEGFRRVDEWRALERTLGSFDAVLFRDDAAFGSLDIGSLPPREKAVLDAIDGERTVRAIVAASHLSSFDACRILVQFLEARVLRRRAS
jgi:DNA-binding response OmpR family regulator